MDAACGWKAFGVFEVLMRCAERFNGATRRPTRLLRRCVSRPLPIGRLGKFSDASFLNAGQGLTLVTRVNGWLLIKGMYLGRV